MQTMELIAFKNDSHRKRFEEAVTEQLTFRPAIAKRELAVLYVLSAMTDASQSELFNLHGFYPELEVAVERYRDNTLKERDATLFILALNLYNGMDAFSLFGIDEQSTPFHFHCKLKADIYLMAEAFKIYREGYPIDSI